MTQKPLSNQPKNLGFFITGSDTEIGKTFVACAIVRSLCEKYSRVGIYKPVASGVVELESSDAYQLWLAAGRPDQPLSRVCPQSFTNPLAPSIAALMEKSSIDIQVILDGYEYWITNTEFTVVEGAGGLLSPITERLNNAELAAMLGLPIVVVVPNRLGCVNQAMMVLEVSRARSLDIFGLVLNQRQVDSNDMSIETNYSLLRSAMNQNGFAAIPTYAFKYLQSHLVLGDLQNEKYQRDVQTLKLQ